MILAKLDNLQLCDKSLYNHSFNLDLRIFIGIEEKSIGNVAKSGSKKIENVIDWGNKPKKKGMFLMHAPAYAPESLSGFSSASCQMILFSTGVGNSFNNHISPTIKYSANPYACSQLNEQLDFKCSDVFLHVFINVKLLRDFAALGLYQYTNTK